LPTDCDHLPFDKLRRWDRDRHHERTVARNGGGEFLDGIEGSDGPISLGCMAGYFDNCANVESEDLNAEAEDCRRP
jgi:hypothetical protein